MGRFLSKLIFYFCWMLPFGRIQAQADAFSGVWQMYAVAGTDTVQVGIDIGVPDRGLLYPARIRIRSGIYSGEFECLIAKKNAREWVISRNKYSRSEFPFSLGNALQLLNGSFDYGRDLKGLPVLSFQRFEANAAPVLLADSIAKEPSWKFIAEKIISVISKEELQFVRVTGSPWNSAYSERLLHPRQSPGYFGLIDTIYLPTRDGQVILSTTRKEEESSFAQNGRMVAERVLLSRKPHVEEVLLDTGCNLMVLFNENYSGRQIPRTSANMVFGNRKVRVGFDQPADSAAGFVAVRIYVGRDKEQQTRFEEYDPISTGSIKLEGQDKYVGGLVAHSRELTLALWDDAVEDGDSISIFLNKQVITRGFPVKTHPQFIKVTLLPGPNAITFEADNLGSIPPNTAVLEIIEGKKRKSYMLSSLKGQNSQLHIYYDVRPE